MSRLIVFLLALVVATMAKIAKEDGVLVLDDSNFDEVSHRRILLREALDPSSFEHTVFFFVRKYFLLSASSIFMA